MYNFHKTISDKFFIAATPYNVYERNLNFKNLYSWMEGNLALGPHGSNVELRVHSILWLLIRNFMRGIQGIDIKK